MCNLSSNDTCGQGHARHSIRLSLHYTRSDLPYCAAIILTTGCHIHGTGNHSLRLSNILRSGPNDCAATVHLQQRLQS
ncbi:predicted protein [Plenodomus lingam JN3]|uniref:Predicted protein n=1 Tax=Leptosphaeria maculans (strain JN3 / isolate v23.1.3 / race Av1-4-5-6-7-8) TaxID=985895 RepID=E4ZNZ4_LEPMJ|nr:predicted protein [Plenodomus lingam JN3]CBX93363.1 predicted protein [Plenodomus lingam JN3]